MARVVLCKGKEKKIQNFYPNVFQDDIKEKIGKIQTGDLVDVVTEDMTFVAKGYVSEGSSAYVRVLSTKDIKIDKHFFSREDQKGLRKKKAFAETYELYASILFGRGWNSRLDYR